MGGLAFRLDGLDLADRRSGQPGTVGVLGSWNSLWQS